MRTFCKPKLVFGIFSILIGIGVKQLIISIKVEKTAEEGEQAWSLN